MATTMVDRCPRCGADRLELHKEWDGNESATWPVFFFECAVCEQYVSAENCAGEYVPVIDDEGSE